MVVDLQIHVEARGKEHLERARGVRVQCDGVAAHEGVVNEPLHFDRAETDATHVRVARHVIEVVDGRRSA
jgi:hypothetical protein